MYLFVVLLFYKQENKYGYKKRVKRGYFRGKCTFFEKKTAKCFAGFRKVHTFALAKTPIMVAQNDLMV